MNHLLSIVLIATLIFSLLTLRRALETVWRRHAIPDRCNVQGWAEWSVLLVPLSTCLTAVYFLVAFTLDRPIVALGAWTVALLAFRAFASGLTWLLSEVARNDIAKERRRCP